MITIDRTNWGPGPWDKEPDRVEWRSGALPCLIVRSETTGALCGYVGVPEGHPWHGCDYGEIEADVHGGLTYAGECFGHICHVPAPGESEVWWLGFDCGHAFDLSPGLNALVGRRFVLQHDVYRDLSYVRAQVEALAVQVRRRALAVVE